MSGPQFVDGLIAKAPPDGAPSFVKCRLSINRMKLLDWLTGKGGEWINIDVKESKGGKWYAAINDWKKDDKAEAKQKPAEQDFVDDEIPF